MEAQAVLNEVKRLNGMRPQVCQYIGVDALFEESCSDPVDLAVGGVKEALDRFSRFQRRRASADFKVTDIAVDEQVDGLPLLYVSQDTVSAIYNLLGPNVVFPSELLERLSKVGPVVARLERKNQEVLELLAKIERAGSDPVYEKVLANEISNEASAEVWRDFEKKTDFGEAFAGLVLIFFVIAGIVLLLLDNSIGWLSIIFGLVIAVALRGSFSTGIITFWGGGNE